MKGEVKKANGGEDDILLRSEQYEPPGCPINRQDCARYMTVREHFVIPPQTHNQLDS